MSNEIDKNITEKWVNLEDIAEYLSVSKDTVRTWMGKVNSPLIKPGNAISLKSPKLTSGYARAKSRSKSNEILRSQ